MVSRSSEAFANCYTRLLYFTLLTYKDRIGPSDHLRGRQAVKSKLTVPNNAKA